MKSKSIEIMITGRDESDLELALEEAVRLITAGFTSGGDKNDSGSFSFDVTEEESHEELYEYRIYTIDTDGSERLALFVDAKDKDDARVKAVDKGIENIHDIVKS